MVSDADETASCGMKSDNATPEPGAAFALTIVNLFVLLPTAGFCIFMSAVQVQSATQPQPGGFQRHNAHNACV